MKVLKLLSEALPLVFLLKFFYYSQVEALEKEDTIKSLNGIDFYNASSSVKEDGYDDGEHDSMEHRNAVTHSRGKRFIAFPVGSSFSTAICMTTGVIGNPVTEYISMGLNWGIAYDLPNSTWVLQHANGFGPKDQEQNVSPQIKRRHRRDLYGKVETLINGFCVIKTLIIILVIYGGSVKQEKSFNVAASKNSMVAIPHVANDNDVLAINNFTENYFNKNQIIFDKLPLGAHDADDNDLLLSLSMENCTRTTSCDTKSGDTIITTKNSSGSRTNIVKTKLATAMANTSITTNKVANMTHNVSSLSPSTFLSSSSSPSSPSSPLLLQKQRLLLRPKRYLSFPEGSSFSVAVCFTVGIIGNPRYNYMSFGLNWGVAYDLPNTTWILNHLHGFAKRPIPAAVWHRRSRRALYKEIESVVDNMGYNGRDCILRALCESRQYFQKTKMSMIGEMLRVIFSLPKQRVFTRELVENSDVELYDRAYRRARSIVDCSEQFDCGFSLLELAFGKYSTPPDGYYTKH